MSAVRSHWRVRLWEDAAHRRSGSQETGLQESCTFFGEEEWAEPFVAPLDLSPAEAPLLPVFLSLIGLHIATAQEAVTEELVVTGTLEGLPDPGDTSASVTSIPIDDRLSSAADMASVLDSASGTVVRRLGGLGAYAAVSLRGSSTRQVQVFLDGVPLNPDGAQAVNLSELPLSMLERVDIYRGNAPAAFLASPIGGVVHLVTRDDDTPPSATVSYGTLQTARLSGSAHPNGSFLGHPSRGMLWMEGFTTQGNFRYFDDNATLYNAEDDGVKTRKNNDSHQVQALGRWKAGEPKMQWTLTDSLLHRDEGLPGPTQSPTKTPRLQTTRHLATLQAEGRARVNRWQGRLWHLARVESYDDRKGEIGSGAQHSSSRFQTTGGMAHARWAAATSWLPGITLSVREDRFTSENLLMDQRSKPLLRTVATGVMSSEVWAVHEQITLSPVLQGTWFDPRDHTLPEDTSPDEASLTPLPRIGGLIRPRATPGLHIKGNAGRYFRPPDFTELYGDRGAITGNPDLVPERGWQWDVGIRWAPSAPAPVTHIADLTYFVNAADDQILYIQNSQRTAVPINFNRASTRGVEGAWTLTVQAWLDSQSNVAWTQSKNLTTSPQVRGNQLPGVPEWELSQATSVHVNDTLRLGHTFSYTAGNYWDATNLFLSAPRPIHGAFVRWNSGVWSAEVSVLNLTDQTTALVDRNPLSDQDNTQIPQPLTDFIGYPLPGRAGLLTLRWTGTSTDAGDRS